MIEEIEKEVKRGRPAKTDKDDGAVKGTTPGWRPSSLLGTLKARNGFTPRWVSNDPARIAKMRAEGWVVMRPEDNIGSYQNVDDVTAGKSLSGEIRYRDMIAMMLPPDKKEARDEYYRGETQSATKAILKQTDGDLKQKGVSTYTPKGMPGRIVIE